jgi:hypothetical protein
MSSGRRSDPRVGSRPYIGDVLQFQLEQLAQNSLSDPAVVWLDMGPQLLYLHPALYRERVRLVAEYERRTGARGAQVLAALIDMARPDQYSLLNSAIGFEARESPVSELTNAASSKPASKRGILSDLFGG